MATIAPSVLNVQQGQRAEFRCTVTGNPTPAIEWIGTTNQNSTVVLFGAGLVGIYSQQSEWPVSAFLLYDLNFSSVHSQGETVLVAGGPGNRMSPRAVIRGGVLTFTAVDPADEGEYTCKALNTHGEHTARVSLFVQSMCCVCVCVCVIVYYVWWEHKAVYALTLWGLASLLGTKCTSTKCKSFSFMV